MSADRHARDQGRVIAGKYELVELAGEGGMASVWRAMTRGAAGFSRPVAVKKMKPEFRAMKKYIAMFIEEARVGSELQHPNIVQVYDFCQDERARYYLIMEWVEGMDLGSFVRAFRNAQQATPWPLIVAIGTGALRGLAAAHERIGATGEPAPIVHRDVSPHNILLAVNGIVKLTDFGLARARDRVASLTAPGTVKGKLSYLSPEITLGQPASPLSDVFAMGSVLWEALVGRTLFDGASDVDVYRKIRNCEVPSLIGFRPDLPLRLVQTIHRALAADPGHRYASAREMAVELAEVLRSTVSLPDAQAALGRAVVAARTSLGMGTRTQAAHSQAGSAEGSAFHELSLANIEVVDGIELGATAASSSGDFHIEIADPED